ncbi:autoinducer-2 kinase [Fictibacillus terranigra]|uniref:Autoinducer-2 kinase n=1 Tax=Fictibacillus terranigra TaxID=3058424 RepID=A0ABT8E819_9BACL|nr:autoinducer-2 kinase [Fictibacillus sp. CENA-BCM004]MDN4074047.1 autoinducer-2 kinase [Fictibacillus sp. CENA-BCM004]
MDAILALDAGTGSIRAVVFDTKGKQLAMSQQEWDHPADPRFPGSMNFDVTENWRVTAECIRAAIQESGISPSCIKAISATSMREGFVLYNKEGKEIWACANVDSRASEEVSDLKQLRPFLEEDLYSLSGQTFALGALPRLLWIKKNQPEIYKETATITMLNDWLLYKLCGKLQADPSNGCTTGIFNIKKRCWDEQITKECQIKGNLFPPVHEAGTLLGHVTPGTAKITGLTEGTAVFSGGGDAQLASVGVGVVKEGQTLVSGGSFWQQEVNVALPVPHPEQRIRINCHVLSHLWQYETIVFFPGLVMRWFRDAFCTEEKKLAKELGRDPYELLEEQAAEVPVGSYGITPIFSDVMNFISWRHASPSFTNLSLDPERCGKKELFRAIEENAALVTLGNLKMIQGHTGYYPDEVIFAGGASKGKLWCQILSDVLGIRVKVPLVKEAAALGTAIVAGYGAGIYSTIEKAALEIVQWENIYEPNKENHALYAKVFEKWQAIYKEHLSLSDRGLTKHMWKAPGSV